VGKSSRCSSRKSYYEKLIIVELDKVVLIEVPLISKTIFLSLKEFFHNEACCMQHKFISTAQEYCFVYWYYND